VLTSSISRICWLSLSEVLIEVGSRAYIYRDECAYVYERICTMFCGNKFRVNHFIESRNLHKKDIKMVWIDRDRKLWKDNG
jgi:hypothetical protein